MSYTSADGMEGVTLYFMSYACVDGKGTIVISAFN
jgi:hypothetical protein